MLGQNDSLPVILACFHPCCLFSLVMRNVKPKYKVINRLVIEKTNEVKKILTKAHTMSYGPFRRWSTRHGFVDVANNKSWSFFFCCTCFLGVHKQPHGPCTATGAYKQPSNNCFSS
jgi:hypothetical protein